MFPEGLWQQKEAIQEQGRNAIWMGERKEKQEDRGGVWEKS